MSNDTQQLRLVKSDRELVIELLTSAAALVVVICVMYPDFKEDVRGWAASQVGRMAHRMSVWSAEQTIRSLPETRE